MYLDFNPNINPAYTARVALEREPVLARLPLAPFNASPVPGLTSLYHDSDPGDYGDRGYPGNCGGNLIRDLLLYYKPGKVFDPMSGSGTCRDVCQELGIECWSGDIHKGFDLCDPHHFYGEGSFEPYGFDFVWIHPPYWRQKLYASDSRDLSRAATLDEFLERYALAIVHCSRMLRKGGKLAVLMGDYCDRDEGFVPLTYHTKRLAFACSFRQCATDIIRFSHGASSSRKVYRSAFIPGLHDVCMIFEKPTIEEIAMKSNELRILTEDALEAFWAVVAQRYPQASSGDLPIDISLDLQGLAELAIATWIQSNVPRQS